MNLELDSILCAEIFDEKRRDADQRVKHLARDSHPRATAFLFECVLSAGGTSLVIKSTRFAAFHCHNSHCDEINALPACLGTRYRDKTIGKLGNWADAGYIYPR